MQTQGFGKGGLAAKAKWVPLSERRTNKRQRVLEAGKLASVYGKPGDCTVTDLSDTGASAVVKIDSNYVPKKILLILLRKRVAYTADVVWRKAGRIGLEFVKEHDLNNPTCPDLQKISLLCDGHHA